MSQMFRSSIQLLCLLLVFLLYQTNGGLICACRKPCKVGIKYMEDGSKVRVSRGIGASGSIIPRPEILMMRTTPRPTVAGPKDTPMGVVLEKTYDPQTGKGMPDL